jgi:HSP90 family molecular chaperone
MKGLDKSTDDAASTIIGQFGVGFYSAFMVGSKVTVRSRSSVPGNAPHEWVSNEGIGSFTLAELSEAEAVDAAADAAAAPSVPLRGSSIVIELKDDAKEYCDEARVKEVIAKYVKCSATLPNYCYCCYYYFCHALLQHPSRATTTTTTTTNQLTHVT